VTLCQLALLGAPRFARDDQGEGGGGTLPNTGTDIITYNQTKRKNQPTIAKNPTTQKQRRKPSYYNSTTNYQKNNPKIPKK